MRYFFSFYRRFFTTFMNVPICNKVGHEHLLAVFECHDCRVRKCYSCAEACTDAQHMLTGGVRGIEHMEPPRNEPNRLFNEGAEALLHLERLQCPCGVAFLESKNSAICCVCGTATCSDACHALYIQEQGKCLYSRNYIPFIEKRRQGCRCIRAITGSSCRLIPGQYLSHLCGSRFVEAEVANATTFRIRRGYSQFGQPLESTLYALEVIEYFLSYLGLYHRER
jgi:hypothetical protein